MRNFTFDPKPAAELLNLMSHSGRLDVLKPLTAREWDVTSLANAVNLSQSALSQHLKRLREGGLVKTRREAQQQFYSVKSEAVGRVLATLEQIAFEEPKRELKRGRRSA